jgi:hypothetical protein
MLHVVQRIHLMVLVIGKDKNNVLARACGGSIATAQEHTKRENRMKEFHVYNRFDCVKVESQCDGLDSDLYMLFCTFSL